MEVKYFIVKMLATVSGPARPVVKPIISFKTEFVFCFFDLFRQIFILVLDLLRQNLCFVF